MPYVPLELPPGVFKNGTEYQGAGRWTDCDMMRWFEGTMGPMGGAVLEYDFSQSTATPGISRGMIAWRSNLGLGYTAVGTEGALYAYRAGSADDITPAGLAAGRTNTILGQGFGVGAFGASTYGTPRATGGATLQASTWAMSTFGENLVAVSTGDGKLYFWEPETAQASIVSTAPDENVGVIVSAERHVILYGADGDPRKVQWSSRETLDVWTPQATNSAGDLRVSTSGSLVAARNVRGQVLLWTNIDLHAMNYIGGTLVYGIEQVGNNCGAISPNSPVVSDSLVVWMGENGFFMFDGFVRPQPCEVWDYVFGSINLSQKVKVYALNEPSFGEVTWFYPSAASNENDRFVRWNYRENHWAVGSIAYTAAVPRGVVQQPLGYKTDGVLMALETGYDHETVMPYAESGPVELGNGDRVMHARKLVPDVETTADAQVTFKTRFYPNASETSYGPYTLSQNTDIRFTGRQVAMRVTGTDNTSWRWGKPRLEVVQSGKR